VLAGLCRVVPETAVHVDADPAAQLGVFRDAFVKARVQISTVVLPAKDPCLVVDPRTQVADLVEGHSDDVAQAAHGPVDGVAQADDLQLRRDGVQVCHVHRHRVRVVEEPRIGTDLEHVLRDGRQHGERAQCAEDTSDAHGVADGLAKAESGGHLEVDHRRRVPADLDRVDDEVGSLEGLPPVEVRRDHGCGAPTSGSCSRDALGRRQPVDVDVVQVDLQVRDVAERQQVREQVAGEDNTAGAEKRDRSHGPMLPQGAQFCKMCAELITRPAAGGDYTA